MFFCCKTSIYTYKQSRPASYDSLVRAGFKARAYVIASARAIFEVRASIEVRVNFAGDDGPDQLGNSWRPNFHLTEGVEIGKFVIF